MEKEVISNIEHTYIMDPKNTNQTVNKGDIGWDSKASGRVLVEAPSQSKSKPHSVTIQGNGVYQQPPLTKESTPSRIKQKQTPTMSKSQVRDGNNTNIFVFNNFINVGLPPGMPFMSQQQAAEMWTRHNKKNSTNNNVKYFYKVNTIKIVLEHM